MAILDMIPPEYWRQLRKELNALDWEAINSTEEAARQQSEQVERERREREFDAAIRKKRSEYNHTPERIEKNREAQKRQYKKVKAMREQNKKIKTYNYGRKETTSRKAY